MQSLEQFDFVIIGGGLVGASLAVGLAQVCPSLNILVLEQKAAALPNIELNGEHDFSQKTIALNQGAKLFFESLGVSFNVLTPIKSVHVSMQNALGQFQFTAPSNYDALGYIIPIFALENVLSQARESYYRNLHWVQPSADLSLETIPSGWQIAYFDVTKQKKMQVKTKCLIGSDGPYSIVKKSLGISDEIMNYDHIATIANVRLTQPHQYLAYERFTQEGGALALLPFGKKSDMTMVLTHSSKQAKMYQDLSEKDFLTQLSEMMGKRMCFEAISQRIQVPLSMRIAEHQVARRTILMGNSAHLLHPIAAQGFNLSIQDIRCLIKLIKTNLANPQYIGSGAMLHEYAQAREAIQKQTIQVTDKIAHYYSSQRLPTWLKGISLLSLNHLPLKNYFTQKSMGIA